MVDSVVDRLEGLVLSAREVAEFTGWPEPMIEDYLTIIENITFLAREADETDRQLNPSFSSTAPSGAPRGIGVHIQIQISGNTRVLTTWSYLGTTWTITAQRTESAL